MNDMTTYVSPTERVKAWLEGAVLHIRFNNREAQRALDGHVGGGAGAAAPRRSR